MASEHYAYIDLPTRLSSLIVAFCKHTIGLIVFFAALPVAADTSIDFGRDIQPILSEYCFHCHGPDPSSREAELRLDEKDSAFAERDGYRVIRPGKPDDSELMARITTSDSDLQMPPAHSGKELSKRQIELLRQWIANGADWAEHWAFVPPEKPEPPTDRFNGWAKNEIDHFVGHRLLEAKLAPEAKADRRTLIRRLYLDLLGLPPTVAEVQAFLADKSDGAYERLVDRLLSSPHFGERMAVEWLDQARYADTNGFSIDGGRDMWLWRDWVINAYNKNLPFDQFVTEQLAGDLLPNATLDQRVASGFNRNHMITHEGGTIPEENLVNYAADRVRTTAEVFLGLTMGCAQCHDHKYDPLSQRDYYRFFAYFNTLSDYGLDGNSGVNASPKIKATSILNRDGNEQQQIRKQLEVLRQQMQQPLASQPAWETKLQSELAELGKGLELVPAQILKASAPNRNASFELYDDGSLFLENGGGRSPSILVKISQENVNGLRLVFYPDRRFPKGGIGYGKKEDFEGSLLLTFFSASVTSTPAEQVDLYKLATIENATASAAHADYPATNALDPHDATGWSPGNKVAAPQHITFRFKEPISASETPYLTIMLVWAGGHGLSGGRCQLYTYSGNDDQTNIPADIQGILAIHPDERTDEQLERLRSHHASIAPELATVRHQIRNLQDRLDHISSEHEVMVMNTAKKPRTTHILNRGQYDQPGEVVTAGVPASLPQPSDESPQDRLGLARWLVQSDHPLTSRVAVNRLWQMLFGRGIVTSSADFGSQGARPTHPQLLDWLACEFIDSGWDVKHMIKLMVVSAAYQQRSETSAEKLEVDPYNQLLSRGPRFRLSAEFVRDAVLQTSDTLVKRIGGPSVRPYQPPNLWREVSHFGSTPATAQIFVQDHGERLYRRSLYTYWKRTVPPPSMVSFDAPNREVCTVQRARTNTPLQALVLLNDPQFLEASRNFAELILAEEKKTENRIRFAFERALSRPPTDTELAIVRQTLENELARFRSNPNDATAYISYGESSRSEKFSVEEHAAWTTVASLIFNLSEMITKS